MATFELTLISASIPPHVPLDLEPEDTYAIIRCAQEQQRSKTTHDHGRTPVWNETFAFNLGDQDVPKFIFVQIFAVRSDTDEFLGVARIPIFTSGETDTLHVLVSPDKGETGKLKAVWRWKSMPKQSYSSSSSSLHDVNREERDHSPVMYPPAASPYDEVTGSMAKLAVHKGQDRELYPPTAYSPATYPPSHEQKERSSFTSEPYQAPNDPWKTTYPPPNDLSQTSYPPSSPYPPTAEAYPPYSYPPTADAYPPYHDYQKFSSSSEGSYVSSERERENSPSSNTRGLGDSSNTRGFGDSKDKGHHSHHLPHGYASPGAYGHHSHHSPHGYAPPGAYGGGYPPPAGYPSPYGPSSGAYTSAPSYPPAPAYPPAPYGAPPAQYGYPPSGYPQAPYPTHTGHGSYAPVGHGSYAPGMYVGHSSHGKHGKHGKHHKMPKHSMYGYGHMPAQYGHYKHKKHKGFGKGFKLKKFKGFKKFKF